MPALALAAAGLFATATHVAAAGASAKPPPHVLMIVIDGDARIPPPLAPSHARMLLLLLAPLACQTSGLTTWVSAWS